ncbi:MAG: aminopeptidase P family protein [Myxococcales bacterium]|nr:aminopeptidase P family protein [Myxococcales bacterium]
MADNPRLRRLRAGLDEAGVDGALVLNLFNVRYYAGFTGSSGALVVGARDAVFTTDFRYMTQAAQELRPGFQIAQFRKKFEYLAGLLRDWGLKRVAFEDGSVTVRDYEQLRMHLDGAVELVPHEAVIASARQVKDAEEFTTMRRAIALAEQGLERAMELVRPGTPERDVAQELEFEMRRAGATGPSFSTIVASGPRGALPHARPTDKRIERGDLVTIDFGALYGGYCSDQTVTVGVGEVPRELMTIFEIVKEAHDRAVASVRPGMTNREVDAHARDYIGSKGYGEYFGHGTGHGIGLEVHEPPFVSPAAPEVTLVPGMVFTVEPGIYVPDRGGVRLEDIVRVTETGVEVLTNISKAYRAVA